MQVGESALRAVAMHHRSASVRRGFSCEAYYFFVLCASLTSMRGAGRTIAWLETSRVCFRSCSARQTISSSTI